jgi:hypothetical protein
MSLWDWPEEGGGARDGEQERTVQELDDRIDVAVEV